jgi:hypothetical protein
MRFRSPPPREMPAETAAWGAETLPPDDPYRQIGDTLYVELYTEHAADLAIIPAPAGLTTFDLADLHPPGTGAAHGG